VIGSYAKETAISLRSSVCSGSDSEATPFRSQIHVFRLPRALGRGIGFSRAVMDSPTILALATEGKTFSGQHWNRSRG
jgi:hypothetical protein